MAQQSITDFISAAAQDLLKRPVADGTGVEDAAAELEKKKKNAAAQTGDNAVLAGLPGSFNGAFTSLMNKAGSQF